MATRQYIGARYVIKVYENSLNPASAEWEAGVNYEPITMVTYNNGSYLSKMAVPASVGNPALNPTYWVQTGFYNGQIAAINEAISALQDKQYGAKVVFMPINKNLAEHTYASGDCTVFLTSKGHSVMIDSGNRHSYGDIVTELVKLGITHIDYFILTHFHYDHYSNVESLITDGYIDANTISYLPRAGSTASDIENEEETRAILAITQTNVTSSSDPLTVDDMKFDFFNCDAADYSYYNGNVVAYNNYCTCCYVTYKNTTILMTADIEPPAMEHLLEGKKIHKCDIMKAAHHGYDSGNIAFMYAASPEVVPLSLGYNDTNWVLKTYSQINTINQMGAKVFSCGYGAIYVGLNDTLYDVIPQSPPIYDSDFTYMDLYVNASNTERGNGSQDNPFNSLDTAIAFAAHNFNSCDKVVIYVIGDYTYSDVLYMPECAAKLRIVGEHDGSVNKLKFTNRMVIHSHFLELYYADCTFSGEGIHIEVVDGHAVFNSVNINGEQKTGSLGNQRAISCVNSKFHFGGGSISQKGVCFTAYESAITVNSVNGSDNTALCAGRVGSLIFTDSNIAHSKLVDFADNAITVDYNGEEGYASHGEFMLKKSISYGADATLVFDFSGGAYNGAEVDVYTSNGDKYLFNVWTSSMSNIFHAITGTLQPGQHFTITATGAQEITITHNEVVRVFVKK